MSRNEGLKHWATIILFASLFSAGCGEQEYNVYFRVNGTGTLDPKDLSGIQYWNNEGEVIDVLEGTELPWQHEEIFECDKAVVLHAGCKHDANCVVTEYYVLINGKKYDQAAAVERDSLSGLLHTPACRWW